MELLDIELLDVHKKMAIVEPMGDHVLVGCE